MATAVNSCLNASSTIYKGYLEECNINAEFQMAMPVLTKHKLK